MVEESVNEEQQKMGNTGREEYSKMVNWELSERADLWLGCERISKEKKLFGQERERLKVSELCFGTVSWDEIAFDSLH